MPRPICFMIMPYGEKSTGAARGSKLPPKVNFDRLWELAFEPLIHELGYEPVRADQDWGSSILQEMLERLTLADLVIADVTIANANVYYEVGVRHAARRSHCVMISADDSKQLFDIAQMRQARYPLPTGEIGEAEAARIRDKLRIRVRELALGDSPVFTLVAGFPDPDPAQASAVRREMAQLATFQAEIREVRRTLDPAICRERALALRDRYCQGAPLRKAVALELLRLLRDCAGWADMLAFVDRLSPDLQDLPLVREQRALAVSETGEPHAAIGALEVLIKNFGETSERRGLLGGRYKRLFREETNPDRKKQYLDRAIAAYEAGMRLDLNDYYPASNLARLYQTRGRKGDSEKARIAAAVTAVACERARTLGDTSEWLKPTLLGAAFDAGDTRLAEQLAEEVATEGAAAWQLKATLADLENALELHPASVHEQLLAVVNRLKSLLV